MIARQGLLQGIRKTACLAMAALAILIAGVYVASLQSLPIGATVVLIWLAALVVVWFQPAFFFGAVIVAGSNCFGLVDLEFEIASEIKLNDAIIAALFLPLVIRSFQASKLDGNRPARRACLFFINGLLVLVGSQILITILRWDQTPWATIKAAKVFLYYGIAYVGVLAPFRRSDARLANGILMFSGILMACIAIVGAFLPLDDVLPGAVITSRGFGTMGLETYRTITPVFPLIFLALFMALFSHEAPRGLLRHSIIIITGLASIALAFRAFWIGIIVALTIETLLKFPGSGVRRRVWKSVLVATIALAVLVMGLRISDILVERLTSIPDEMNTPGASLAARMAQMQGLWQIYSQNPVLGAGFLHQEGAGGPMAASVGLLEVGSVDVGFFDLLVKFGLLGLAAFSFLIYKFLQDIREIKSPSVAPAAAGLHAYIIMALAALPGSALFSYPGGAMILASAIGILMASPDETQERQSQRNGRLSTGASFDAQGGS